MVTPSPRGAVSRAGPATHAVETSTRDKGSATAAAAGRSTKKNRASSTIRLAFEVWGWVCVLILVYGMYEGLDERRVHMLNVYYQAPVVVTVAMAPQTRLPSSFARKPVRLRPTRPLQPRVWMKPAVSISPSST